MNYLLTCQSGLIVNGVINALSTLNVSGDTTLNATNINGPLLVSTINRIDKTTPLIIYSASVPLPTEGTGSGAGLRLGWNCTGGGGECDLISMGQGGLGGFNFYTVNGAIAPCNLLVNLSPISMTLNSPFIPTSTTTFNLYHPTTTLGNNVLTNTTQYATVGYVNSTNGASILPSNNTWTGQNSFNSTLPTSTLTPTTSTQLTPKSYVDRAISTYAIQQFSQFGSYTSTLVGSPIPCTWKTIPIAQTQNITTTWCLYGTVLVSPNIVIPPPVDPVPVYVPPPAYVPAFYPNAFSVLKISVQQMDSNLAACGCCDFTTMIFWGRWCAPIINPQSYNCSFYPSTYNSAPNSNSLYNANNTIGYSTSGNASFPYINGTYCYNYRQYWSNPYTPVGYNFAGNPGLSFYGTLNSSNVGTLYLTMYQPTGSSTGGSFNYSLSVSLIDPGPFPVTLINSTINVNY